MALLLVDTALAIPSCCRHHSTKDFRWTLTDLHFEIVCFLLISVRAQVSLIFFPLRTFYIYISIPYFLPLAPTVYNMSCNVSFFFTIHQQYQVICIFIVSIDLPPISKYPSTVEAALVNHWPVWGDIQQTPLNTCTLLVFLWSSHTFTLCLKLLSFQSSPISYSISGKFF